MELFSSFRHADELNAGDQGSVISDQGSVISDQWGSEQLSSQVLDPNLNNSGTAAAKTFRGRCEN